MFANKCHDSFNFIVDAFHQENDWTQWMHCAEIMKTAIQFSWLPHLAVEMIIDIHVSTMRVI